MFTFLVSLAGVVQTTVGPFLPVARLFPLVYHLHLGRLLKQHYQALADLEGRLDQAQSAEQIREIVADLDLLHLTMKNQSRRFPGHLQGDIYQWRGHIALVRRAGVQKWRDQRQGVSSKNRRRS